MLDTVSLVKEEYLTDEYVPPVRADVETAYKACERIHEKLLVPKTTIKWETRLDAIKTAKRILGLEWEVQVRITDFHPILGTNGANGVYYVGDDSEVHDIRLIECMHPIDASLVLWHELRHAAQAELIGSRMEFYARYLAERKRFGNSTWQQYVSNPFEAEAYATEIYHFDICQLTKEII